MLLELSVPFYPGMPKYDETIPEMVIIPETRQESNDPNNTTSVKCFLHMGTHVDAPYHFDSNGATVDKIPIKNFLYKTPVFVNLEGRDVVARSDLENIPGIKDADLLLIYTGISKFINDPVKYPQDFIGLDYGSACFLRRELPKLVAVGIDALSIERDDGSHQFPVHHELLDEAQRSERSLLIFENLNLSIAENLKIRSVYAFPLRLVGLDASPVTVVAEI